MNLVAMSALAYWREPQKALALAERLVSESHSGEVIVDWPSVLRMPADSVHSLVSLHVIPMHRWVRENTDGYRPDEKAISEDARSVPCERILLLDATGFDESTIIGVLNATRMVWFSLATWHKQFVLVVDDGILLPSAEALFNAFHCRPYILTGRETRDMARVFMRQTLLLKWRILRRGRGKLRRLLNRILTSAYTSEK